MVSIVLSGLVGTGGVGFTIVQWLTKRHDPVSQATAAQAITTAAGEVIGDLRAEKQSILDALDRRSEQLNGLRRAAITVIGLLPSIKKAELIDAIRELERWL